MRKGLIVAAVSGLAIAACNPVIRTHGYVPAKDKPEDIIVGEDSRETVQRALGNPSARSLVDDDTWYYITEVRQQLGYFRATPSDRKVVAIRFGLDNRVEAMDILSLEDGYDINFEDRETPTRGRELTVLEQVFGTIGRLPADQLNQDNLPGGAGGPRRDGSR